MPRPPDEERERDAEVGAANLDLNPEEHPADRAFRTASDPHEDASVLSHTADDDAPFDDER